MSSSDFQAAIALAITQPDVALALRQGNEARLQHLDLTEKERSRLRGLAQQPGLAFYCSLARAHRIEAIAEGFPMTLVVMESGLREFLDQLWNSNPPSGYRFDREIECFVSAVEAGLSDGSLHMEYLSEVLRYERACWALAQSMRDEPEPHPPACILVEFDHPPDRLLPLLSRLEAPPAGLPCGKYRIEIQLERGQFTVREISD